MNENSCLNPNNIKEECNSAIRKLENDNEAIRVAEDSLNTFFSDGEIKSEAFGTLRQQMSDYITVLQALRTANNSDIADFTTLQSSVGDEILIGGQILEQKSQAEKQKKADEATAESYERKARNTALPWKKGYYNWKADQYWDMAEMNRRLYLLWQEKEDRYDEIEGATSGLFASAVSMRTAAEAGLSSIGGAFQNGVYAPDSNASWRADLADCYMKRIMNVSADGTITANWEEVEKVLRKPAGEITQEEYQALALLYLNIDEAGLSRFLGLCMDKSKEEKIPWYQEAAGMSINFASENYSEWTVNEEKMKKLVDQIAIASDGTLLSMRVVDSKTNEELYDSLKDQRNIIIQRMTLLKVAGEIGTFRGEYQGERPTITIKLEKDEGLTMTLCEYRNIGSAASPTMSNLGASTVNISKTKNGASIDKEALKNVELTFSGYFGGISVAEETLRFTSDEVTSEMVSQGSEQLAAYIAQKTGKEVLGNAIGYIPFIGDVAGFGIDMMQEKAEAENVRKFMTGQFESIENANVYSDFDCSVSFVQHNTADSSSNMIYVQAGENTADIIERVNEKLGTKITESEVITKPNDIHSLINQLKEENPDNEDRYDEAINNK